MTMDWTGTEIVGYRVVERIGEGGMATVWKAEHPMLGKRVAIKVLDPLLARDEQLVRRFLDEARIQCELRHPNIVAIENFSRDPLAMVMEYVEGRSLAEMIGREVGPIPFEKALPLMRQILDAVGYAHQRGVIHRDIKPANVLVAKDGAVKVMDFGIAKILGGSKLTRTGTSMGTAAYMSPEQVKGARDVDARSDIYALGITFYEMLAGRTPFEGDPQTDSDFTVREAQVRQEPPDPRTFYPAIPEAAVRVLNRALAKQPGDRYQSAGELGGALERVGSGSRPPQAVVGVPAAGGSTAAAQGQAPSRSAPGPGAASAAAKVMDLAGAMSSETQPATTRGPETPAGRAPRKFPTAPVALGGALALLVVVLVVTTESQTGGPKHEEPEAPAAPVSQAPPPPATEQPAAPMAAEQGPVPPPATPGETRVDIRLTVSTHVMDLLDRLGGRALAQEDWQAVRRWALAFCQRKSTSIDVKLGSHELTLQVGAAEQQPSLLLMTGAATYPDAEFPLDLVIVVDDAHVLERLGIGRENLRVGETEPGALPQLTLEMALGDLSLRKVELPAVAEAGVVAFHDVSPPSPPPRPDAGVAAPAHLVPPPPPPAPEDAARRPPADTGRPPRDTARPPRDRGGSAAPQPPPPPPPPRRPSPPPPWECSPDHPDYPYC